MEKDRKEKKDRKGGAVLFLTAGGWLLSFLTGILATVLILYSGYVLYDTFYTQNRAIADTLDLLQFRPQFMSGSGEGSHVANPSRFSEVNPDYSAWLTIYDTRIDYPVVQGPDDLYYASHDAYGEPSLTGAIYLSSANSKDWSDTYNLVYGHHMDNGAMFGTLDEFRKEAYLRAHKDGVVIVGEEVYQVTLFAVVETHAFDNAVYDVGNRDIAELLESIRPISLFFEEETTVGATKILAMSTCAGATTYGRLIVYGVMEEIDPGVLEPDPTPEPTPTPKPTEPPVVIVDVDEPKGPMSQFIPRGEASGDPAWSLVDLILTICTAYMFLPLLQLKAKYSRPFKARKLGDKGFMRKFLSGIVLEMLLTAAAIILFIFTQDMRSPMILIDRWTPLFLLACALSLTVDIILIRYRQERALDTAKPEPEPQN